LYLKFCCNTDDSALNSCSFLCNFFVRETETRLVGAHFWQLLFGLSVHFVLLFILQLIMCSGRFGFLTVAPTLGHRGTCPPLLQMAGHGGQHE